MRVCRRCAEPKADDSFPPRTRGAKTYLENICKACGAARQAQRYSASPATQARRRATCAANRAKYPAKAMIAGARKRAAKRGLAFTITEADLNPLPATCPVLGVTLNYDARIGQTDFAASLDRIRNAEGYEPGNILIVSHRANRIKSDATPEELARIATFYSSLEPNTTCH